MKIKIKEEIEVKPEYVYEGTVKKSGNGGVINSLKRFIGRKATILIHEDEAEERNHETHKMALSEMKKDRLMTREEWKDEVGII